MPSARPVRSTADALVLVPRQDEKLREPEPDPVGVVEEGVEGSVADEVIRIFSRRRGRGVRCWRTDALLVPAIMVQRLSGSPEHGTQAQYTQDGKLPEVLVLVDELTALDEEDDEEAHPPVKLAEALVLPARLRRVGEPISCCPSVGADVVDRSRLTFHTSNVTLSSPSTLPFSPTLSASSSSGSRYLRFRSLSRLACVSLLRS
jgi:hypothetical protein